MTLDLLDNPFVKVLLVIIGFLLVRLLHGLDELTKATASLTLNVKEISVLMAAQNSRLDTIEKDSLKNLEHRHDAIELMRARIHDISNQCMTDSGRIEVLNRILESKGIISERKPKRGDS